MGSNYVPGTNAHIDTSSFSAELEHLSEGATGRDLDDMEFERNAYDAVERILSDPPDPVPPDTVVCRFLSTEKFLWFLNAKSVFFGRVEGFDDSWDCAVPDDYANAISRFYSMKSQPSDEWEHYADGMRYQWLISCWTAISSNVDDYLLWYRYAGGPDGVGITVPYGILDREIRKGLPPFLDDGSTEESILSGYVDYGERLRVLPFNKRRMFKNESEVRFVVRTEWNRSLQVSVGSIFNEFGLRLSPDAPIHHRSAIEEVWFKYGGSSDIVVAEN